MRGRIAFVFLATSLAVRAQSFELATVKPTPESSPPASIRSLPGGRLETTNVTLRMLIKWAWDLDDDRLSGGPKWLDGAHYDVVGQAPAGQLPRGAFERMMQTLIRDRFHLTTHNEIRELTAYEMVLDKSGPKVQVVDASGGFSSSPFQMTDRGRITGTKVTATMLAKVLSEQVHHPVEDATGFKDAFNFTLEWASDSGPSSNRPSIFTAIREQLGFRLDAKKKPDEVLVIDSIDRTPTGN
ncbi:MAG TPA: TIGR03435 family protein [Bryobacteraceae bacterium]|nr:TIGR03435 family protein [Bryobacteraceae bacterium]